MAITFNPTSLTVRAGYKSSVQITSTTAITSVTSLDTSSMTVVLGGGTTTRTCIITVLSAKNGPVKIRVKNSGGETVDFTVTLLGIDTSYVSGMLGLPSSDVGTLCKGLQNGVQKINKWSKWKPISHPYYPRTEAILKQTSYGMNIQGIGWSAMRSYALSTYNINDPSTNIKWTYYPPSGGVNSPFVLDDFRGYDPGAKRFYDCQRVANTHPYADGYGLTKFTIDINPTSAPSQYSLQMSDFNIGTTYYLGVALIDYEADGYPTRLVKINSVNFDLEKEITIDVTSLPSSTYIVVLFLQQTNLGNGLAQVLNPSETQMSNFEDADYWWALEDGLVAIGLSPYVDFTMWEARKYTTIEQPLELVSSDYYRYYPGAILPTLNNTTPVEGRIEWNSDSASFSIERQAGFDPSYQVRWKLYIPIYIHSTAWTNGGWNRLVGWDDMDGVSISLMIKTEMSGNDRIVWIEFRVSDESIGDPINTGVLMPELSIQNPNPLPLMITLSNADANLSRNFTITVGDNEYVNNSVATPWGVPGSLGFGYDGIITPAPRGLAFQYIALEAEGNMGAS